MIDGCISIDENHASTLASLAIQAELGSYDDAVHTVEHFRNFYLFPENLVWNQDEDVHTKNLDKLIGMTIEKYRKLTGLDIRESEMQYVEYVQDLAGYGEEMLPCQVNT